MTAASVTAAAVAVPALLLLADGRFPAGGHVHSAGVEAAVADGRVTDLVTLEAYLIGRLHTVGLTEATLAAAMVVALEAAADEACRRAAVRSLDAEAGARIPAPVLREASRRQGRQLVRVAGRCWPAVALATVADELPGGAHLPVALGATAVAAGIDAPGVAGLSLHHAVTTPAQAALRLLGLDPFAVAALTAQLAAEAEGVRLDAVERATSSSPADLADLPAASGPLVDIAACEHRGWDMRLFAT